MDGHFVVRAFIVGFGVAAPVGPIGVLVMDRSIARGMALGFVTGLGAATADALFALAAALGLGELAGAAGAAGASGAATSLLRLVGAIAIAALGVRALLRSTAPPAAGAVTGSYAAAFATTLGLTLISPMTILTFAAVAASVGFAPSGARAVDAGLLAGGVLLGSAAWWAVLSGGCAAARRRLPPALLVWLRRGSGALLVVFGAYAVAT